MALAENDSDSLHSIAQDTVVMEKQVADMEFRRMFNNPMDANNCFVDIQSGSGGTEAQDWASMLLRMYLPVHKQHWHDRMTSLRDCMHQQNLHLS